MGYEARFGSRLTATYPLALSLDDTGIVTDKRWTNREWGVV